MKAKAVVVITGASSGIGRACAIEFYRQGFAIVAAARSLKELVQLGNELDPARDRFMEIAMDVTDESACENLIESTIQRFGQLDVLINNAGITMRALFKDVDLQVFRQLMDVNFWGVVYCTKYAMPYLLQSKGTVVGMSSVAGYKGLPTRTGYAATKFAIEGFLESLRIENLKTGLHVLIARPGFVATNIRTTMRSADGSEQGESHKDEGKSMTPEEVASKLYIAVSQRKRTMILSLTARLSFLLNKFFPSWLDKQVFKHVASEKDSPLG